MNISANGLNLIKQFEGFSGTVNRCPAGVPTIGYGHTGKHVDDGIVTEQYATEILAEDCADAEQAIAKYVKVPLTQNQFDALVSLVFNIGTGA